MVVRFLALALIVLVGTASAETPAEPKKSPNSGKKLIVVDCSTCDPSSTRS